MVKNFTEEDILQLKIKLRKTCAYFWKTKGYKLTSVAVLTKEVGISTGSFYRLYETKEELFLEVFWMIQNQLKEKWDQVIQSTKGIEGFKNALKMLFREYAEHPMLYNFNNADLLLFLKKIPTEEIESLKENNKEFFSNSIKLSGLDLKIPKEQAYGIFSTLLFTATMEKDFGHNKFEIFDFLLESSIYKILAIKNSGGNHP
jgi:AcrR family transcriptional regulator